ncbi:2,3-diaminopropionate biosynthesis protein SbnB [Bradyrhizobium prioriisuperbiae]|uniref:2,3-diaminopropionate biosynthesis protein SbnB n=1 Tax=Bradyrhizobium prioriisuperbiae TaxID=2854389 RepID=UPI0028EC5E6F|nr:2,3-diaminopropionate biosynthesis protein SbnB [Bradyrhizobium prioritasuperba]
MAEVSARAFSVIGSDYIKQFTTENVAQIVDLVKETYRIHGEGKTINPDSYFLRFPGRPSARIIALPAAIKDQEPIVGLKWISSFPENLSYGLNRASAVLILNDYATGYPLACMEGSNISAARTAASAVCAAELLHPSGKIVSRMGVIGAGPIARTSCEYLIRTGWKVGEFRVLDLEKARAEVFADQLTSCDQRAAVYDRYEDVLSASDLVLFATTAAAPYINDVELFRHNPTVLHLSLRDLSIENVLSCQNIVDDVEHCLKANTSVHLTEQCLGHRKFVSGTISQLIAGEMRADNDRPRLFSPFGLGILDLAVGRVIYNKYRRDLGGSAVAGFFPED